VPFALLLQPTHDVDYARHSQRTEVAGRRRRRLRSATDSDKEKNGGNAQHTPGDIRAHTPMKLDLRRV
jgi:hypothetical protein